MKVYQGYAASSGLVLGQVSRVERRTESFGTGPFNPDREQRLLDRAVRPLEVIDKDFICFTTTNPENRYIRMKGIGNTNNLRSTYFREILVGEQDEELYRNTKKYKVVSAFRKAGIDNGETT